MSFSAPIGGENLNIANKSLTTNKKLGDVWRVLELSNELLLSLKKVRRKFATTKSLDFRKFIKFFARKIKISLRFKNTYLVVVSFQGWA